MAGPLVVLAMVAATCGSAILAKEATARPALLRLEQPGTLPVSGPLADSASGEGSETEPKTGVPNAVWFNGKKVVPVRTLWMRVTAYSPDHRSCGIFADGQTATLHSVWTNAGKLAAADTDVLPFGSMISVPGYDGGRVIPVLDRGGAIKGDRLDLLFPTHEEALQWGVRLVPVQVWGYADGSPIDDPRKLR